MGGVASSPPPTTNPTVPNSPPSSTIPADSHKPNSPPNSPDPTMSSSDPKTSESENPSIKDATGSKSERDSDSSEKPSSENDARDHNEEEIDDEEEEGECGFCLFMKAGGCKEAFIAWENCVREAEDNKEDIVEKCFQVTGDLKKCMEAHADYYEPILRAEKAAEEEVEKRVEEEEEEAKEVDDSKDLRVKESASGK